MVECNANRILIVVVVILTAATLILVAVLIWKVRENTEEDTRLTEQSAKKAFPSFFRTPEQQNLFEDQFLDGFLNRTEVKNETIPKNGTSCVFSCKGLFFRKKRAPGIIYHGCCVSSVTFVSPSQKVDVFGQLRTILQFTNAKQYFPVHLCQSVKGCKGCICSQEKSLQAAVILKVGVMVADDFSDLEIGYFYFDGCCKCINV